MDPKLLIPFIPKFLVKGYKDIAMAILERPAVLDELIKNDRWAWVRYQLFNLFTRNIARAMEQTLQAIWDGKQTSQLLYDQLETFADTITTHSQNAGQFEHVPECVLHNIAGNLGLACRITFASSCNLLWDTLKTDLRQGTRVKVRELTWRADIEKLYDHFIHTADPIERAHVEALLIKEPTFRRFAPLLLRKQDVDRQVWSEMLGISSGDITDGYKVLKELARTHLYEPVVRIVLVETLAYPQQLPRVLRTDIDLLLTATSVGHSAKTVILFAKHLKPAAIGLHDIVYAAQIGVDVRVLEALLLMNQTAMKPKYGHKLLPFALKSASCFSALLDKLPGCFCFTRDEFYEFWQSGHPVSLFYRLIFNFNIYYLLPCDMAMMMVRGISEKVLKELLHLIKGEPDDFSEAAIALAVQKRKYSQEFLARLQAYMGP